MTTEVHPPTNHELLSLAPRPDVQSTPAISEAEQRANEEFLTGAYAPNMSRSYRFQLRTWAAWCVQRGSSLRDADPDTLVTYIREQNQRRLHEELGGLLGNGVMIGAVVAIGMTLLLEALSTRRLCIEITLDMT